MNEENEITPAPMVDGSFVETAFGREDFNPTDEDSAKRIYRDTASSKANGLDPRKVREWAHRNGITTGKRGKFSATVVQRYIQEQE